MIESAGTCSQCRWHDTLYKTHCMQYVKMPIYSGTTASNSKGKVLHSLKRVTQQPLEQSKISCIELTQQFMWVRGSGASDGALVCIDRDFHDHVTLPGLLPPVV